MRTNFITQINKCAYDRNSMTEKYLNIV